MKAQSSPPRAPLVSVVIPAYNCERFIGEALDSVFAQDYPSLEVIVVDDGSTDDTCGVVARYGETVRLIRQRNAGAAVARNQGLAHARGDYVALLDSDDLWLPGKLRLQIDHLEKSREVAMCCTRWDLLHPDAAGNYPAARPTAPESARLDPAWSGWIYCELLLDCEVWTSTVVMRRELAGRVGGFDPELRRGQDYDYWLRASRLTRIDRLDAPLALYRMQVSHDRKYPDINWELTVIRRSLDRWGAVGPDGRALPEPKLRARLWALNYRFGHMQYRGGRYAQARDAFAAALRERPLHLKTALFALASKLRQGSSANPLSAKARG